MSGETKRIALARSTQNLVLRDELQEQRMLAAQIENFIYAVVQIGHILILPLSGWPHLVLGSDHLMQISQERTNVNTETSHEMRILREKMEKQ